MKLQKTPEGWELELEWLERVVLAASLEQQAAHYRIPVEQLEERLQSYWRGRLTQHDPEQLREAQNDLAEVREAWRSERLKAVEHWLQQIDTEQPDSIRVLTSTPERMETWVQVLNERRLLLEAV